MSYNDEDYQRDQENYDDDFGMMKSDEQQQYEEDCIERARDMQDELK